MTRVTLYAEFTALEGQADEVAVLLATLTERVRAEPGNLVFDTYRVKGASRRFFVFEVYRNESAFQEHIAADYGALFNASLSPLIVEDASKLTFLTPSASLQ